MASNDTEEVRDESAEIDEESATPVAATDQSPPESESTPDDADDLETEDGPGDRDADALLPEDQSERFTTRWEEIQSSFVDRPQEAVEQADALVVDLMQRVTGSLTTERERLEGQWARGEDVSTEDLRLALTRYRAFFDRLLST
jgi:hypothetical protein